MELAYLPVAAFQAYLLASFVLGLMLSAKCLVQMAFPQCRASRWAEVIAGLAAVSLAVILSLDALGNGGGLVMAPIFLALTALGLSLTLVAAHLGVSLLHSRRRQLALQPVAWMAVALTLAATGWASHRYSAATLLAEMEKFEYFATGGDLVPLRNSVGVTDRGREVLLYRWLPEDGVDFSFANGLQLTAENGRANCHGWVFTGGEHLLWRDGVELILEDNGYELCQTPLPGDLIVYRNPDGETMHTGVVKTRLFGGGLMIESKWGVGGRFVHRPEQQPYGNNYSYYRSARQGHALAIRPAKPPMRIASL
ncbi:MAG: hypothetical protein ACR2FY_14955 [Pirellulaceae bacterium]